MTFRQLSASEIIALAADAGLAGIEWGGDVHVPPGDFKTAEQIGNATRKSGLSVVSYGSYFRCEDAAFQPILDTTVALGAPGVRVWAGTRGSAQADAEYRSAVVNHLAGLADAAEEKGLSVSVEYHPDTLTDTLERALGLIETINRPNLRLYWQPRPDREHGQRLHELRSVLPVLSHLHVFQWEWHEGRHLRHPLASGDHDWRNYLESADGERFALLEFVPDDNPALLLREAATLKGWLQE